jgi:GNAT superfamily N-acetyltransferase
VEPSIQRCVPEQSERLTRIAHAAKRHWGYPERYIEAWRPGLTVPPEMIREHHVYGARIDGELVGFYVLIERGNRMELEHMWVDPGWIRRGVGRRLMQHAIELSRALECVALDITSDPNAEGFYLGLGARRVDRVFSPVEGRERYLPRLELPIQ